MAHPQGVYILANDYVFDLVVTFLNSFRKHNPTIPLCLVPFDADICKVSALADKYCFEIYDNMEVLDECDRISERFHDAVLGHYRKLAIWSGVFDTFLYFDVDSVVLKNIDFAFKFTSDYDFIVAEANDPSFFEWVWENTIYASGKLTEDQIVFSANTGFIASKRGALTMLDVRRKLPEAIDLKSHMKLTCAEQPFLNYLIVTSEQPYTSLRTLHTIENNGPIEETIKNNTAIPLQVWGAVQVDGVTFSDGQVFLNGEPINLFSVHWAGVFRPAMTSIPNGALWDHYRSLVL